MFHTMNVEEIYELLPGSEQNKLKVEISEACGFHQSHFYKIKNGQTKIGKLRKREFIRVFTNYLKNHQKKITEAIRDLKNLEHEPELSNDRTGTA